MIQNTAPCNTVITAYLQEFSSTFQNIYEILVIDGSKSHEFTTIAGCFFTVQYRNRIISIQFSLWKFWQLGLHLMNSPGQVVFFSSVKQFICP